MLGQLKALIDRSPRLGWMLALLFLAGAVLLFVRLRAAPAAYSYERMTQNVRVRCSETGEEWAITRGEMERDLLMRPGQLKATEGLINPKTGKPTGFPVDEWQSTIDRLNAEKAALATGRRGHRDTVGK